MKKLRIFITFIAIIILIFIIFYFLPKNYKVKYKVSKYNVYQTYNKKTNVYTFNITNGKNKYVYALENKFKTRYYQIKKVSIKDGILYVDTFDLGNFYIKKIDDKYYFKNYDSPYDANKIKTYKNIDIYNNQNNIYVWNYTELLNINNNYKSIKLFNNDMYDLPLTYQFKNYLVIPDYNSKYTFNKFYIINTDNNKVTNFSFKYDIYYNSYFMGDYKNNIYLYDMQNHLEYKINIYKETVEKVSNQVLKNDYFKKISTNKLDKGNVKFEYIKNFYYEIENEVLYFVTPVNKIIASKLKVQNIVYSDENNCYFISNDTLYFVNKNLTYKIMTYSEWNFNNDNIFVF